MTTQSRTTPSASERLAIPGAILSRGDLAELGWPRRAVDAIFRGCPPVVLPGYRRAVIRVEDYQAYLRDNTYDGTRVR